MIVLRLNPVKGDDKTENIENNMHIYLKAFEVQILTMLDI